MRLSISVYNVTYGPELASGTNFFNLNNDLLNGIRSTRLLVSGRQYKRPNPTIGIFSRSMNYLASSLLANPPVGTTFALFDNKYLFRIKKLEEYFSLKLLNNLSLYSKFPLLSSTKSNFSAHHSMKSMYLSSPLTLMPIMNLSS